MIEIRKATINDKSTIVAFNMALARESENKKLDIIKLTKGVTQFLKSPRKGFYILAEVDGEVVGQIMITIEWSDWRNGEFWWIQSVYIKPEFRRMGVYRSLHETVMSIAEEDRNVCGLRLYVEEKNRVAQTTYLNMGMKWSSYRMMENDFVFP